MCGILGAFNPGGLDIGPLVAGLNDLHHRGPDAQSYLVQEDRKLFLGHVRLKIIDISDVANQPMVSPCGRYTLIFNGEIYNFHELRAEIGDRWQWRTRSDTEVLLAAWTLWGSKGLGKLVGMFSFAVYDAQTQTLTLVRDRFGIKPLYLVNSGCRWVFSSEIPPLLRFLPHVEPDNSTIRTYLEYGIYDHGPKTFFAGVEAVQSGCLIEIDLRTYSEKRHRWYCLAEHIPDLSEATERELLDRAEALVLQAVKSNLVADVEVGLNVSGGVDSSVLTRVAVVELGHVHLFTQDYPGYSEVPWVREIAAGGTLHIQELEFADIDRLLHPVMNIQAEPYGGVTVCGYDAVYAAASAQGVTVLLDGNGVDEVFLGYSRYHENWVWSTAEAKEQERRAADYRAFWGRSPSVPTSPLGVAIDGSLSTCPEAISAALLKQAPLHELPTVTDFECPIKNLAATDLLYTKIPRGLRFNDRMSMAHSRELRVPFLDHRLVEFAYGVPTNLLLGRNGSKALFRKLAERHMPASIAFSPKRSVQSPQREWMATGWRKRIDAMLDSPHFVERGWINPNVARTAWQRYLGGARDNSFYLWQWLNLELWAQEFLDG